MAALQHFAAVYALLLLSAMSLSPAKSLEEEISNSENSEEIESLRSQLIASLSSQRAAALANEKREVEGTQDKQDSDEHGIAKRAHYRTLRGNLKVLIERASSLRDTDGWLNKPDPYVRVTAFDSNGRPIVRSTSVKQGTQNPVWNQWLDFGRNTFQDRFSIRMWDQDANSDDALSSEREYHPIEANYHGGLTHHGYEGSLRFSYHMIMDGLDCSPNPCLNGGTCTDLILSHTCSCRPGYGDLNCRHRVGRLRVYARNGRDLQDRDGWGNNSDPYMEIIAYDGASRSTRRTTSTKQGTQNPNWYQTLDFGTGSWKRFSIRVWDNDNNADDALSGWSTIYVTSGSHYHIRRSGYRGHVELDYHFN